MKEKLKSLLMLLCVIVATSNQATSQCNYFQIGSDIDGENNYDASGWSISLSGDGNIVAIGAPFRYSIGGIKVYKHISGIWTQLGSEINGDTIGDEFGAAVALSADGSTVAVGSPYSKAGGIDRGLVRVYKLVSGTWVQLGLDIIGEYNYTRIGRAISLSPDGTTLAIGNSNDIGGGILRGSVSVYKFISGSWTQLGNKIYGEADNDYSGWCSLSYDGTTIAIGSVGNEGGGIARGHVRVFALFDTTWIQIGATINGGSDYDVIGKNIFLSSDASTIAIGADNHIGGGGERGRVRVYKQESGNWIQQGADFVGVLDGDKVGSSVALSSDGNILAFGAVENRGDRRGRVSIFKLISGAWVQQGVDIVGENNGDLSGRSVSLSSNGSTVAISSIYNDGIGGVDKGHVRVFKDSCSLSIDNEYTTESICIYPNPSHNFISITGNMPLSQVDFINAMGQHVNYLSSAQELNQRIFDISNLETGIYYVKISTENGTTSFIKLIKNE